MSQRDLMLVGGVLLGLVAYEMFIKRFADKFI